MIDALKKLIPQRVKSRIRRAALGGDIVECPICEGRFITFLPFGVFPRLRANALCPGCHSLERTRIYWRYIESVPGFFESPKRVLHVAPEQVLFQRFSRVPHFDYYPVDKFEAGYKYPAGTRNVDITNIPFPDGHFDFILCSHVLEHIPEDVRAMRELFRVLKPGGSGIIQVPVDTSLAVTFEDETITTPEARLQAYGQSDHVRMYGTDYAERLRSVGFEVEENRFAFEAPQEVRFRFGFGAGETLHVCRKAGLPVASAR